MTVGHEYTAAGTYDVGVRAEWHGRFWVNGDGPWQIQTPATQQADPMPLQVVESRNLLGR